MYFYELPLGVCQNMHYYKGYGPHFAPATIAREVHAVTGALMVLNRRAYDGVGGFGAEFVVGDYEDSDLCLKLRGRGGICYFDANVELFHFEGQSYSIAERESGVTIYNRQLHPWSTATLLGVPKGDHSKFLTFPQW